MQVNFEYVNVDVSPSLSAITSEKLEKLFNRFEFLVSATVYFKIDEKAHDTGKICNIELSLPGPKVFATAMENNFETAVRHTLKELERQLEKRKDTFKAH